MIISTKIAIVVDIQDCPRCRQNHGDLILVEMNHHAFAYYTHFGLCPELNEPILAKKHEDYPRGWLIQ